jgi:bisanhydrobacterioruberin hydratase
MMQSLQIIFSDKTRTNTILLVIFYLVGIVGIYLAPAQFSALTPFNLVISAILIAVGHIKINQKTILVIAVVWLASYFLEMLGTNTGHIFGNYLYGDSLGIKALNTPVIIGLNWIITCYCSIQVANWILSKKEKTSALFSNKLMLSITAAAFMVFLDIFIEQVASVLDFWHWENDIIPLQNYVAWFFFGFVFCYGIIYSKIIQPNKMGLRLYFIQLLFFIILNIIFH